MPDFRAYIRTHLALPLSGARETEIVEELALDLEDHYARLLEEGLSPDKAWEQVVSRSPDWREFACDIGLSHEGEAPLVERQANLFARGCQAVRFAFRLPRRSPGFTVAAVLVIALGIGPNAAMFSIIYSVFIAPPPWADKGELAVLWGRTSKAAGSFRGTVDGVDRSRVHISPREYQELEAQSTSFRSFVASIDHRVTLDDDSEGPESIWIQSVTPGFLTTTGTKLQLGRDFLPEEGVEGNQYKVVISNRLWKERFGGDSHIVGKRIRLDGEAYSIVGVAAPGGSENRFEPLWTALAVRSAGLRPADAVLTVIGQLKRGVGFDQAQAEVSGIVSRVATEYRNADASWSVRVEPYRNTWLTARTRGNLWLLMCAVGLLLLVACVNVANLLLARGASREKEVAVRASLGATRWQLFQQTLADTLFLFALGGLAGAILGAAVLKVFLAILPLDAIPGETHIAMSIPSLLFAGATTLITGFLFGCYPAWRAAGVDIDTLLKQGGGSGKPRRSHRLCRALVIVECSLTLTLLAGAGVAVHTWWTRTHLDLGMRTDHILTFELQPRRNLLPKPEQVASFYNELIGRIRALPGVKNAGALNTWGLLREPGSVPFAIGRGASDISKLPKAAIRVATPGYFETFGVGIVNGRGFNDADRGGGEPVVMVNEKFAHAWFAGKDPSGEELSIPAFPFGPFRIVGVYRDVQNAAQLGQPNLPEFCLSFAQVPQVSAIVAVRTAGEPEGIVKAVGGAIHSIHSGLPMASVATVDQIVHERLEFDRFDAVLYGAFAALAMVLAIVGIHGVMAFIVAQQTREIGLRIALGATPSSVRWAVLKDGVGLASAGLTAGAAFAWYGERLMQTTLYGSRPLDGATLVLTGAVLLAAAALGCGLAARRAASIEPMVALRSE